MPRHRMKIISDPVSRGIRDCYLAIWVVVSLLSGMFLVSCTFQGLDASVSETVSDTNPAVDVDPPAVIAGSDNPDIAYLVGQVRFDRISLEQGLSQSVVGAILQDHRGFMWFGTQDGLNRYDGYEFRVYKHDPEDDCSISDNFITVLLQDRDGGIWVGTNEGGLNRYDPVTECFTRLVEKPDRPEGLNDDNIQAIFEDREGMLWVGSAAGGLYRFDRKTGVVNRYQNDPYDQDSLSNNNVNSIFEDRFGALWAGSFGGGLNRLDRQTGNFTRFQNDVEDSSSLSNNLVQVIYEDRDGSLWIGTFAGGLNRYDRASQQFDRFVNDPKNPDSLGDNNVQAIYQDRQGVLWIGTQSGGLNIYDHVSNRFIKHRNSPLIDTSLSNNDVQAIYEDRAGVLWIGNFGGGLNKFDRSKHKFAHYKNDPNDPNSLSENVIWSILEDRDGDLWIGTNGGGLNHLNRQTRVYSHFRSLITDTNSLSSDVVWTLHQDQFGQIWIGTNAGLDRLDRQTGHFIHYGLGAVFSIHTDREDGFWIGTFGNGLGQYNPDADQFNFYANDPQDPASLSVNAVAAIHEDADGFLWVGTFNGGLNKFDKQTGQFIRYQNNPDDPASLSHNTVMSIHQDRRGDLWVGTGGGGLNKLDLSSGDFVVYRAKDGLDNYIYGILEDEQGNLWLSTNNGVLKFDPATGSSWRYGVKDGLQSREFNKGAYYKSTRGEMFFGGVEGFNAFYPNEVRNNPYIPPIVITEFQLFNEVVSFGVNKVLSKPIEETDSLRLTYQDDFFAFKFAALHFSTPENNQYAYQMEGLDKDWNYVGNRNFASYTNVPPGKYVFRVKGTNGDGVWNETGALLEIVVVPPFWQTTWFRVFAALIVVGAIAGAFALRLQVIQAQKRQLEVLVDERTCELQETLVELRKSKDAAEAANRAKSVFLANISHELRTPLNAILGFSQLALRSAEPQDTQDADIGDEQYENLQVISRSGEHLLGLINDVLEMSKIEAGRATLNESSFDLRRMLAGLEEMFQLRAEDKGLLLDFDIAPDVPPFVFLDEGKLRQVLMNLLGNAIKFTQEGRVTLRASVVRQDGAGPTIPALHFEVEDTGPGIAAEELETIFDPFTQSASGRQAQEGTGLGLSISRRFAELMGGKLTVRSRLGAGSLFLLELPVSPAVAENGSELPVERRVLGLAPDQPAYRLLVVDDKEVNRALLVKLLTPLGFAVREAANGREAVEIWQAWEPHLIWMDMRMPVMDGYEATRRIKATTKGQATVVVALTASALEEDREIILSEGCDAYMRKPFREHDLFETLRRHLGVKFLYQQPTTQPETTRASKSDDRERLARRASALPATLLEDLRKATILGYQDEILQQVARIVELDALLADELAGLAKNYEHDKMLALLEHSGSLE